MTRPRDLSPHFPLSPTQDHPPTCRSRPPPSRRAPRGRASAEHPGVRTRGCDRPQRCEAKRPGSSKRLRRFLCRLQRGAAPFSFSLGAAAQRSPAVCGRAGDRRWDGATERRDRGQSANGSRCPRRRSLPRPRSHPPVVLWRFLVNRKPPCRCEVRTEKERRGYESGRRSASRPRRALGFASLRSAWSEPVQRRRHAGRAEG